jgi:hypothetical protein
MVQTFNPSTLEAEAEGLKFQASPRDLSQKNSPPQKKLLLSLALCLVLSRDFDLHFPSVKHPFFFLLFVLFILAIILLNPLNRLP